MIRIAFTAGTFIAVLGLFLTARHTGARNDASQKPAPPSLEQEIKRVEAEIDKIFADTLAQMPSIPAGTAYRMKRVQTLGKLELFDKQLSVNRNTACTFCHMPDTDFTRPISMINATTSAYARSLRNVSAASGGHSYGHWQTSGDNFAAH